MLYHLGASKLSEPYSQICEIKKGPTVRTEAISSSLLVPSLSMGACECVEAKNVDQARPLPLPRAERAARAQGLSRDGWLLLEEGGRGAVGCRAHANARGARGSGRSASPSGGAKPHGGAKGQSEGQGHVDQGHQSQRRQLGGGDVAAGSQILGFSKGFTKFHGCLGDRQEPDCNLEMLGMWDNTPLLAACMYGHSQVALKLIGRQADVFARNEHGATALHYSSVEGCLDVSKGLLEVAEQSGSVDKLVSLGQHSRGIA